MTDSNEISDDLNASGATEFSKDETQEERSLLDEAAECCPRVLPYLKIAFGLYRDHTTDERLAAARSAIEFLLEELDVFQPDHSRTICHAKTE